MSTCVVAAGEDVPVVLHAHAAIEELADKPAGRLSVRVIKNTAICARAKPPLRRQTRAIHSASRPVQPRAASAESWLARSWTGGRVMGLVTRSPAPDRRAHRGGGSPSG